MKFKLNFSINIDINKPSLYHIMKVFISSLRPLFEVVVTETLRCFALDYMENGTLSKLVGYENIIWKTKIGNKVTKILTIFGYIKVPQLQILLKGINKKVYITRLLLGIEKRIRIPELTRKILALGGSLVVEFVINYAAIFFKMPLNFQLYGWA